MVRGTRTNLAFITDLGDEFASGGNFNNYDGCVADRTAGMTDEALSFIAGIVGGFAAGFIAGMRWVRRTGLRFVLKNFRAKERKQ